MTAIYRAPMRARDRDLPLGAGAAYGVAHGLVGVGEPQDAKGQRGLSRFGEIEAGAFVWTQLGDGTYRLGRISGPLREDDSPDAQAVGIRHVRPAEWLDRPFGDDETPAAVIATFARGGRNFQRTHDADAERQTAALWQT